jgi:hypothetical protein
MPEIVWTVEGAPAGAGSSSGALTSTNPQPTFRDMLRLKSPMWLQRGLGEKILYAIGLHMDGFGEALVQGVKARFPGVGNPEALALIGRERRIRRGREESDQAYVARLQRWLDDHRTRGGPYALLSQLYAHYTPNQFQIDLVYASGRRFRLLTSGEIARDDAWSAVVEQWARWTLFYSWPVTPSPSVVHWGDVGRTWGDGKVWGSSLTVSEVTDLRLIPREWIAAHAIGEIVLLTPDVLLWGYPDSNEWGGPGLTWGSEQPVRLSVE